MIEFGFRTCLINSMLGIADVVGVGMGWAFSSVQFSHSVVSNSLRRHGLQHARPPCPSPIPGVYSWVGGAIQPSHPLSSSSSPTFYLSQHQGLFRWVSSLHQVAKVLDSINVGKTKGNWWWWCLWVGGEGSRVDLKELCILSESH